MGTQCWSSDLVPLAEILEINVSLVLLHEIHALAGELGVCLLIVLQHVLGLLAPAVISSYWWMMGDLLRKKLNIVSHELVGLTQQWVERLCGIAFAYCKL